MKGDRRKEVLRRLFVSAEVPRRPVGPTNHQLKVAIGRLKLLQGIYDEMVAGDTLAGACYANDTNPRHIKQIAKAWRAGGFAALLGTLPNP
ncbi:MAG: hypothetical protein NT105_23815 [Verrucomicrobia bacterium]|nr:hypothetical protein [Verrucomicrobiota bacterium]